MRSFIATLAIFSVVSARFLADDEPVVTSTAEPVVTSEGEAAAPVEEEAEAYPAAWVADPACAAFMVERSKQFAKNLQTKDVKAVMIKADGQPWE